MCRSVNQAAGLKERRAFVSQAEGPKVTCLSSVLHWRWSTLRKNRDAGVGHLFGECETPEEEEEAAEAEERTQRSCCVTSTMWAMVGGVGGFYWISVSDNPNLRERRLTVTWLCVSLMKRPQMTHLLYVWYINYTTHILGSFCLASLCIYLQIGSKWLQFLIRGPTNVCMETSLPPSNKNTAFNIFQTYFLIKILHLNYNIIENHYTFCSQTNVFNHILI